MRELPVDLDEDTLEALETERRLIGFESRAAYVRWIVDQRGSIGDASGEDDRVLEAYRRRIEELERRLEAATDPEVSGTTAEPAGADAAGGSADERRGDDSESERGTDGTWRRWEQDPTIEVRGRPRRTVRRAAEGEQPAAASVVECGRPDRVESDTQRDRDGDRENEPRPTIEAGSATLTPERVVRLSEDPVSADADVLESVEVERLDELSRRAVAKTRERLDRDVETGLEYRSTTPLTGEDVRPGADLVDLETLSVPGRSEEQRAKRRAVAGRAIAFLRDEGRARKADFVERFYETHPAGYATPESWWSFLKRVFRQVEAVDGGDGARVWKYAG
ncbi:hypothetical protein [Natronococcus wangiae]|uniref:hypothetical protein n=1 Tax=Natronococcus wangiae TaxID=3068275 RepID=UPI00273EBE9C|nr:hypothetical protein [Natronococcus sp. AD5]